MNISVVIITNKKLNGIQDCLKAVDFCDEKIILQGEISDFSEQRNTGMEKAKNCWVLFVDDDEIVSKALASEIQSVVRNPKSKNAFYIKRRDFFWGKELKYGETWKLRNRGIVRLVKKGSGKWVGKVHEVFVSKHPVSCIGHLKEYLNHYPHPTIKEFVQKINFYSDLRAEELRQKGKKFCLCELIFLPFFKFIFTYFVYLGFLDGPAGFVYAFLMSFHSFLVRGKLYKRA